MRLTQRCMTFCALLDAVFDPRVGKLRIGNMFEKLQGESKFISLRKKL